MPLKGAFSATLALSVKHVLWAIILQHLTLAPFAVFTVKLAMLVAPTVQAAFQGTIFLEQAVLFAAVIAKHAMGQHVILVA